MVSTVATSSIIVAVVIAVIAVALGAAYTQGMLDPIIEKIGVMLFKAKAEAEKKKLQAQGMKEGQDFLDSELKGNKEANDVAEGIGGLGGLKKF